MNRSTSLSQSEPRRGPDGATPYGRAALTGEVQAVTAADPGGRNKALNRAAYSMGRLVGGGELPEDLAAEELTRAGVACGLADEEARRTVRSGLRGGMRHPREAPAPRTRYRRTRRPVTARTPVTPAPTPRPTARPLRAEVEALWAACVPVTADPEAAAWLRSRNLDPARVAEPETLARALPRDAELPGWARCLGRPWTAGWRCLFRCWGPTGELQSLRARWCAHGDPPGGVKAAAAAVGEGSARGLVLADLLARGMLAAGGRPGWWDDHPFRVVVAEGEPDWLTWRLAPKNEGATLGIVAGSWTPELAARVPDGALVVLATDPDPAGDAYAEQIRSTLAPRCNVKRWRPTGEATPRERSRHHA